MSDKEDDKDISDEVSTLEEDIERASNEDDNSAGSPKGKSKKPVRQEDELDKFIRTTKTQEKKRIEKKKARRKIMITVFLVLMIPLGIFLFTPMKGDMRFGLCKVFLEGRATYPPSIEITQVEEIGRSIRLWYFSTNSFGEVIMQPIQCYFKQEDSKYLQLEKVRINRKDIAQEDVDAFNRFAPIVYIYPPDLTLPWPMPDKLERLHFEVNTLMRPIL